MKKQHAQPGFILITVFLLLTIAVVVATEIYYQGGLYNAYAPLVFERGKAQKLAKSGIQIAINQLALYDTKLVPEGQKDSKKPASQEETNTKNLLKTLLTVQNKWQWFDLDQEKDGAEGKLGICITCEDGKIPLRHFMKEGADKKQGFGAPKNKEKQTLLEYIFEKLERFTKTKDIAKAFSAFMKKQKYELMELTSLLTIKELEPLRDTLFYVPVVEKKKDDLPEQDKPYFADIFTLSEKVEKIHPFVLTHSVRLLLGLQGKEGVKEFSAEQREVILKKVNLKNISWQKDWDVLLKPVYGKDYKSLPPEMAALLSSKFEPQVFSVLCYAKAGRVAQKLVALIERSYTQQGEVFRVKQLYWL